MRIKTIAALTASCFLAVGCFGIGESTTVQLSESTSYTTTLSDAIYINPHAYEYRRVYISIQDQAGTTISPDLAKGAFVTSALPRGYQIVADPSQADLLLQMQIIGVQVTPELVDVQEAKIAGGTVAVAAALTAASILADVSGGSRDSETLGAAAAVVGLVGLAAAALEASKGPKYQYHVEMDIRAVDRVDETVQRTRAYISTKGLVPEGQAGEVLQQISNRIGKMLSNLLPD